MQYLCFAFQVFVNTNTFQEIANAISFQDCVAIISFCEADIYLVITMHTCVHSSLKHSNHKSHRNVAFLVENIGFR